MKTFKTRTAVHFVFSLKIFVSANVIIMSIMALGMFTNLFFGCSNAICRLAYSEISLSSIEKKTREKFRKRSDIVQFGRWRDSFRSALCSILS